MKKVALKRLTSIILAAVMMFAFIPAVNPVSAATDLMYQTVAAGSSHSFAIKKDWSLWGWGENVNGVLGDGTISVMTDKGLTNTDKYTPVKIMDNVVFVATGDVNSFALKTDGSLWAWGLEGGLGLGDELSERQTTPIKIMDNVVSVSAGSRETFAIKADGSLWAWEYRDYPKKVMDNVVSVAVGGHYAIEEYALAIKTDGSLWTWGYNKYGQLGDGTTENKSTPIKIMDNVSSVSAGWNHSLAIKTDGSLWAWGWNQYGVLGDGTEGYNNYKLNPVKIMDNVVSVSAGEEHNLAIKTDGSLWTWGKNIQGQLGDGTTITKPTPAKIMDNVASVAGGTDHSLAIKRDGSLWAWGYNGYGQLGDGTTENKSTPVKIMDGAMVISEYIYAKRPQIIFPLEQIATVTDENGAVKVTESAAKVLTAEQKKNDYAVDLVTLYAEEASAQATSKKSGNDIVLNKTTVEAMKKAADSATTAAEKTLATAGITTDRTMKKAVKFKVENENKITVTADKTLLDSGVDVVYIETPTYTVSIVPSELVFEGDKQITLTVENEKTTTGRVFASLGRVFGAVTPKKVKVTNPTGAKVGLGLPSDSKTEKNSATVIETVTNTNVGGKYNPITNKYTGNASKSGSYELRENKVDFTDIKTKDAEMQEAIRYLAAKGAINGKTATTFAPDDPISRAEVAKLIIEVVYQNDSKDGGGFKDVKSTDWYYKYAGSSKKYGVINGYEDKTFRGKLTIPKEQIIAIASRALKDKMKYKDVKDVDTVLKAFKDTSSISGWAKGEIALATKTGLVVKRVDGRFIPQGDMTRGEAALIIYNLYQKVR